ncbi:hypothetical protein N7528_006064 [Penicillium herquei]|nr:hypothetical protein N7528_006064 [Penicillium herquei]
MAQSKRVAPLEEDFPFQITSHLIPVTPFREYPHAIIDEDKGVYLAVKQYKPLETYSNNSSTEDPITLIAACGLGFIKEVYEPLFAELLYQASKTNVRIRSIWIADTFNLGESAIANADNLGCDASPVDHARDLWSMISHFRDEMPKPLIGLGHSVGCTQLLCLSSWHPTLFHSFVFIEPGLDLNYGEKIVLPWIYSNLKRKEGWETRAEAEKRAIKSQHADSWNEKAKLRLMHYGVFQPDATVNKWNLTMAKDQVASVVFRHNPGSIGMGPGGLDDVTLAQREIVPDSNPADIGKELFYRRELRMGWDLLPGMRPWVLYVNGGNSPDFGDPKVREERARRTGTGVGGNGGMKLGAVKQVVIDDGKHTMPFDRSLDEVVPHVRDWLVAESRRWVDGPKRRRAEWQKGSLVEKQSVSKEFVAALVTQLKMAKRAGKL